MSASNERVAPAPEAPAVPSDLTPDPMGPPPTRGREEGTDGAGTVAATAARGRHVGKPVPAPAQTRPEAFTRQPSPKKKLIPAATSAASKFSGFDV
jgi:hypothetical protein